ncbi:hypothetical protein IWX90DRAFT_275892 [Phyllosticta citrichinensis]|uniref:Uncharacterized protein n=1 Tax=Phyllosticta citrichinensis TaxID=1130410 RepID=A0ABR1XNC8_9PEZI
MTSKQSGVEVSIAIGCICQLNRPTRPHVNRRLRAGAWGCWSLAQVKVFFTQATRTPCWISPGHCSLGSSDPFSFLVPAHQSFDLFLRQLLAAMMSMYLGVDEMQRAMEHDLEILITRRVRHLLRLPGPTRSSVSPRWFGCLHAMSIFVSNYSVKTTSPFAKQEEPVLSSWNAKPHHTNDQCSSSFQRPPLLEERRPLDSKHQARGLLIDEWRILPYRGKATLLYS